MLRHDDVNSAEKVHLPPFRPCSVRRAAEYDTAFMVCVTAPAFDAPWLGFAEADGVPVQLDLVGPAGRQEKRLGFSGHRSCVLERRAIASGSTITEVSVPMRAKRWSWAARTR
jgi:hypothetical protein